MKRKKREGNVGIFFLFGNAVGNRVYFSFVFLLLAPNGSRATDYGKVCVRNICVKRKDNDQRVERVFVCLVVGS